MGQCRAKCDAKGARQDPKKVPVQLGQVHAGRVVKFTSATDVTAKAATIKAYVREAIADRGVPLVR